MTDLKEFGIDLAGYQAVQSREDAKMAMDAALITTPNNGIPAELLAYFDNKAIDVLTAKRSATEIFGEVKKGDRTTPYAKFRMKESIGYTQPYSDYSDNGVSGVNYEYATRENYLFETTIYYGDLETAESSRAKINLVGDKQNAAALNIAVDTNRFYFNGVYGLENYGILNQPNLPAAIVAEQGEAGETSWSSKKGGEIYNDVVAMMSDMAERGEGLVNQMTSYKMVVSPSSYAQLTKLNAIETETALSLIKRSFPNLDIVVAPEYEVGGARKAQLIATEVEGQRTGENAFSEKFIAGRVVPGLSNYRQKFMAGVYGAIIYRPVFVSTMTGI